MKKIFICLITFLMLNSCSLKGDSNLADIGFLAFLSKLRSEKACVNYAKAVNLTSSSGISNSYTCNYKTESVSMECIYTNAITEDDTNVTIKTEFYKSTEDFISQRNNFLQFKLQYSQFNNDSTTNKYFQYDSSGRITSVIQSDGATIIPSEFDEKNRYTKGTANLANGICSIPFTYSYDETNLVFKQSVLFSQTFPKTNLLCYAFGQILADQVTELSFDSNLFITKRVFTSGTNVTTDTFTTTETAEICTGSDGSAYSAPVVQKLNSTGAAVGESATITGINFDTNASANQVSFGNGLTTTATKATDSSLTFEVPSGATSGQLTVTNKFGTGKSRKTFNVYKYYLYVGNALSNSVSSFEINIADGSLITPNTFTVGNQPGNVIANPNGQYAYIINQGILAVNSASINPLNGSLSTVSSANAGTGARGASIDYTGKLLFVLNQTVSTVSRFSIDSGNGSLVSLGGTPSGVTNPYWLAAHPSLPFLFVTGSGSSNISAFTIDASTGNLNSIAGSPIAISANPKGIVVHPGGLFLYTANNSATNSISKFSINQLTGSLSAEVVYVGAAMESISSDPSGNFLFACSNSNNSVYAAKVNTTDGTLTTLNSLASNQCRNIVVDPTGKYLYATEDVGGSAGKINKFNIQSTGELSVNGTLSLGTSNPRGLGIAKVPQ